MEMNIPQCAVSCYAVSGGKITDPYFDVKVPILASADDGVASPVIRAKNCTDYRVSHKGHKMSMEKTNYPITKSVLDSDPPGVPAHAHLSEEPFESDEILYEGLNDVEVSAGDLMIGFFLDADVDNLVIIHIPHKVPIGGDVQFD